MRYLSGVLLASLIVLQAFLLPVPLKADVLECRVTLNFTTLPPTDVTGTTAVFNGTVSQVMRYRGATANDEYENPWAFEYGTTPGVYPNRVDADFVSWSINETTEGEYYIYTITAGLSGSATGLSPCTPYYVRFTYLDPIPLDEECLAVNWANAVSFQTPGCLIQPGSHQSSGVTGVIPMAPPTNLPNILVQSAAVSAARVAPGEQVTVNTSVINKGGSNGSSKITLYVNSQEVESKGITLAGGQTAPLQFILNRNEPGTYAVYINNISAGSFTVDQFSDNNILILSIAALFAISIAGVLYFVFRRRPV